MRKKIAAAVVLGVFVSAVLPGAVPASAAPAAAGAGAGVRADCNGDGVSDLAIGIPDEDSAVPDSGAVSVIYGSAANGLRAAGNQLWTQDSPGIRDAAEAYDGFGHALAAGDFNGDGFSDLAVGVPFEILKANRERGEGAVNVIYGSAAGLTAAGNQFWTQDSPGVGDVAEADDQFGYSLAAGNLGGSAHDDLAIGVPAEDPEHGGPTVYDTGAVNVIYGTKAGLAGSAQNPVWTQDSPGIAETAELHDQFGLVLAIGNFGLSKYDDLAVGVPEEATGPEGVHVIYGAASGLSSSGSQYWSQNSPGIADAAENDDRFGRSLAAGDLGRSAYDDLAIGAPSETLAATLQGAVHVIYGAPNGLAAAGSQFWSQDSAGIADAGEAYDQFGWALTIGDFGRSAQEDLAVGAPSETLSVQGGAVNVIYGAPNGLTAAGNQIWSQDSPGIAGTAGFSDAFGLTLTAANFGRSAHDDLVVGVPWDDAAVLNGGAVNVFYGSPNGLAAAGSQFWSQDSPGIADAAETGDGFGASLTADRN